MYYPKSQIKTNLYTNGNEFYLSTTGESYIGYYFKTSSGETFTGRTPDDRPNVPIFPINQQYWTLTAETENGKNFKQLADNYDGLVFEQQQQKPKDVQTYNNLNPQITNVLIPYYFPTLPTQQDYQNGEFRRYFCKKTNQTLYIEINQEQYDKLVAQDPQIEFSLYQPFFINWQLTGNKDQVAKVNRNSTGLVSTTQKLPMLDVYLRRDWTKYYQ